MLKHVPSWPYWVGHPPILTLPGLHLILQQASFRDLFRRYDVDRDGVLNRQELRRLIQEIMPRATSAQIRYFAVRCMDYRNVHVCVAVFVCCRCAHV